MSISDKRDARRVLGRTALTYLLLSLLCALLGAVYERFSHGVYSYFMLYAFAVPLAGGAVPCAVLALGTGRPPGAVARGLWHAGLAALTVGCLMAGVLEIYGTASGLLQVYWWTGGGLLAAAGCAYLLRRPVLIRRRFLMAETKNSQDNCKRHRL